MSLCVAACVSVRTGRRCRSLYVGCDFLLSFPLFFSPAVARAGQQAERMNVLLLTDSAPSERVAFSTKYSWRSQHRPAPPDPKMLT